MPETVRFAAKKVTGYGLTPKKIRSSYVEVEFVGDDEQNDQGVPYVMSITTIGSDLSLTDDQRISDPGVPAELSLSYCAKLLVEHTEEYCARIDPEVTDDLIIDTYAFFPVRHEYRLDMAIRNLIYRASINFLDRSSRIYENYNTSHDNRFHKLLIESRDNDEYFNVWLENMRINNVHYSGICSHHRDTTTSLFSYLERKLDINTSMTPLDLFVLANAYNAELFFYETFEFRGFSPDMTEFKFMKRCFYNYHVPKRPRPIWIIIRDAHGCFYPITHQLGGAMFYTYKHEQLSTVILDKSVLHHAGNSSTSVLNSSVVIDVDA